MQASRLSLMPEGLEEGLTRIFHTSINLGAFVRSHATELIENHGFIFPYVVVG
jgi:hypothetical protein